MWVHKESSLIWYVGETISFSERFIEHFSAQLGGGYFLFDLQKMKDNSVGELKYSPDRFFEELYRREEIFEIALKMLKDSYFLFAKITLPSNDPKAQKKIREKAEGDILRKLYDYLESRFTFPSDNNINYKKRLFGKIKRKNHDPEEAFSHVDKTGCLDKIRKNYVEPNPNLISKMNNKEKLVTIFF